MPDPVAMTSGRICQRDHGAVRVPHQIHLVDPERIEYLLEPAEELCDGARSPRSRYGTPGVAEDVDRVDVSPRREAAQNVNERRRRRPGPRKQHHRCVRGRAKAVHPGRTVRCLDIDRSGAGPGDQRVVGLEERDALGGRGEFQRRPWGIVPTSRSD